MSKTSEEKIAEAKEILLDPFHPVFPMPGMWHLLIGNFLSLFSFFGALLLLSDIVELHPGIEFIIIISSGLIISTILIFAILGFKLPATIMLYFPLSPILATCILVISDKSLNIITFIFLGMSIVAFLLLRSLPCRALSNIMYIRRQKIKQMKQDGTYNEKLAAARKRLGL